MWWQRRNIVERTMKWVESYDKIVIAAIETLSRFSVDSSVVIVEIATKKQNLKKIKNIIYSWKYTIAETATDHTYRLHIGLMLQMMHFLY